MTEQNEPSMEAILASIRSILAEDDDETPETSAEKEDVPENPSSANQKEKTEAPAADPVSDSASEQKTVSKPQKNVKTTSVKEKPAPAPAPAPEPEPVSETEQDGILDLTEDMIVDEPDASNIPEEQSAFPSLPDKDEDEEEEDDFTPEPVIPKEPMKEETLTDLIKENAAKKLEKDLLLAEPTVAAATESLSHLRDIAVERQLELGNASLTLENIVRETLKPYLKEWLDAHLPEIVERVVRKEVAHIMDRLDLK